jgi:NAD+ diphosphatase
MSSCCMAAMAFAGSRIDRADHIRSDPDRLAQFTVPAAKLLRLAGLMPQLDQHGRLQWDRLDTAPAGAELVFLGIMDGYGCFAAVPQAGSVDPAFAHRQTWQAIGLMSGGDMAIYGGARSLVDWHARHRFCAVCGQPSALAKAGWQRSCTDPACGAQHFPRVDPVTIMLVEHAGRLLLGRQARFPAGRYSALAGFVEPGESIEEAVAREVFEEAGVRVRDVTYIASQPWPFPSQLMIGCHALADDDALVIDLTELEDARWWSRSEVEEAITRETGSNSFIAPPKQAIAHQLLRNWLGRI